MKHIEFVCLYEEIIHKLYHGITFHTTHISVDFTQYESGKGGINLIIPMKQEHLVPRK